MGGSRIDDILARLQELQNDLEGEIDRLLFEKREQFRYTLEQGKIRFEAGMRSLQRRQKEGLWRYLAGARLAHVLSAPIIYSLIVPLLFIDLMATIYQHACFRVYGIPRVKRARYLQIDRHHLAYLNIVQKANCVYCGYANGVLEYVREIGARTEQYWCPIKHAVRSPDPHRYTHRFVDFGDSESFQQRFNELRKEIKAIRSDN